MNILQPLTIHTSVPIRPLATTRKLIQMYVLSTQSALLRSTGTEVFKPCQPLLFPSSGRACTQVVTFLYAGRRPLLWRGSRADYNCDGRVWKPAKQIRKWSPARAPSGRWFSWLLLGLGAEPCLFSLTAAWTLPLLGGDLFRGGRCCCCSGCGCCCMWRYARGPPQPWACASGTRGGWTPAGRQSQETVGSALNCEPCGTKNRL